MNETSGDKQLKVVGYARVSTEEQAQSHSTESQIHYLKEWATQNNWKYIESYIDNGYSGGNEDRPGLKCMLKDAKKKKFDVILFSNSDRLGRDPDYAFKFFKILFSYKIGVAILSLQVHGIITDLEDPNLNMNLRLVTMFDEYYRKLTIFKTKAGMKKLSDQGLHMGRAPTFFRINKETGKLQIKDNRIKKIWDLADQLTLSNKRPYNLYSRIAKKLKIEYSQVYRAIKNRKKLEAILKNENK